MVAGKSTPHPFFKDMTGLRFGRYTVIRRAENCPRGTARWECLCDCGNTSIVDGPSLRFKRAQSCGCLAHERTAIRGTKHGLHKSKAYHAWYGMKERCEKPEHPFYKNYGGRGIIICERWQSRDNFIADMGEPEPGLELDRIDTNGNYEPGNCRWVPKVVNMRNRTNTIFLEHNGVRRPLAEWAEMLGVHPGVLRSRIRCGWPIERIVTEPKNWSKS